MAKIAYHKEIDKEWATIFETAFAGSPHDLEAVLLKIKEAGLTQMQSALLLTRKFNISIKEADEIVVKAKAWRDVMEDVTNVREQFGDMLDSITDEELGIM
jgi:hypothetical protein